MLNVNSGYLLLKVKMQKKKKILKTDFILFKESSLILLSAGNFTSLQTFFVKYFCVVKCIYYGSICCTFMIIIFFK